MFRRMFIGGALAVSAASLAWYATRQPATAPAPAVAPAAAVVSSPAAAEGGSEESEPPEVIDLTLPAPAAQPQTAEPPLADLPPEPPAATPAEPGRPTPVVPEFLPHAADAPAPADDALTFWRNLTAFVRGVSPDAGRPQMPMNHPSCPYDGGQYSSGVNKATSVERLSGTQHKDAAPLRITGYYLTWPPKPIHGPR